MTKHDDHHHKNHDDIPMIHHKYEQMKHEHMEHGHMEHKHMGHEHMEHEHTKHGYMEHGHMGHNHSHHILQFKQKFWVTLVLAIPVIFLSPFMGYQLPFQFQFVGSDWIVALLSTIIYFYGGEPFLTGGRDEIKAKTPGMMLLIAMGISVAYLYSIYAFFMNTFGQQGHIMDFFWELASLVVIMLLGHWIEMSAISNASSSLQKLAALLPDDVIRLTNGQEETIAITDIQLDDVLIVKAGAKIPADGIVIAGESLIEESAITGESKGVVKKENDPVIGGAINGDRVLTIRVTAAGDDSFLAQVMTLVRQAQNDKSRLEILSDRVAKWLFYIATSVGLITFLIWSLLTDLPTALQYTVTVLIIACPHALGLAIPLVVSRSTTLAAQNGLLLKKRMALETASHLDAIFLDKTGTLTKGAFEVVAIEALEEMSVTDILAYTGALEKNSNHPIAKSIMAYLKEQNITSFSTDHTDNLSGKGISGTVEGKSVKIVNQKELENLQYLVPNDSLNTYQEQGYTLSFVIIDDKLVGLIALGDTIKPEALPFIQSLKQRQITPIMLTGDNQESAAKVAQYLGITNYFSELLPTDKEKQIATYVAKGKKAAMVGDGINDAPSLARASVGIAIGAGTDIAIDSADVVLTNSNPEDILHFVDLAKQTHRKMIQNLWWGAGYNLITIPLAAGILAPIGFTLNPAIGAILMSFSTVIVAINAMTLKIKEN
ncbi:heavy metal translocating P-type ATPase [Streptococcus zalophi]